MNLEFLRPLIKYLPEVKLPRRHVSFKEKLIWTSAIMVLFFLMGTIYPVNVSEASLPAQYQQFTMIFASSMGSIISAGIGPIVTASIILQLLIGAKIIDMDMSKQENKALFQGTQKILTILLAFFEAAAIVYGFGLSAVDVTDASGNVIGRNFTHPLVELTILQIALGSIFLMYMDEIVSKWGISSGISLFIAGGVAQHIMTASLNFLRNQTGSFYGYLPNFLEQITAGNFSLDVLLLLSPIIATIIIFLIVVYSESMRLEIPLSYGGIRGIGGRYPLKFLYVSNIPVILASSLLMNVTMWTKLVGVDIYSPATDLNQFQKIVYQIASYVTLGNLNNVIPNSLGDVFTGSMPRLFTPDIFLHMVIYFVVFVGLCILFGKFWVETTGLGAEQVAEQIQQGGMQIPGFRRDKRIVERVLNRYIPQITIISSVSVGLLAFGADMIGALGSGTGILLTVGILYRLYEDIQREQMSEMHPAFRKFMGKV